MCGFGLSRATRKNAETRAKQAGVFTQIQDAMNRWRTGKVRTTKFAGAWHGRQMESLRLRLTAMQLSEELQGYTDTEWILSDLDVDVWFWLVSGN